MSKLIGLDSYSINRRTVLKGAAAGATAVAAGGLFAPAVRAAGPVKIGYVTPQSGPLAAFGEADKFVIDAVSKIAGDKVQIITKDSQSDSNKAAEAAKSLIADEGVSLILVASTPETTNPVASVCEVEQIPCISTV
eukprot:gene47951-65042_t